MATPPGQLAPGQWQARFRDGSLAGEWVLDARESSVRLESRVMGLIRVRGVFREVSGTATVGPDGGITGTVTVSTASIDTGNAKRDTHLRSADFFGSDDHPDITFRVDGLRLPGPDATVTGALTVRGRSRPLSFGAAVSVRGDGTAGLDAVVRIDRGDFGLTWNTMGLASMMATVTFGVTFTRAER